MPGDYDVGYGKPPKHGRFRKGRSGNPKGRSKGAKNLKTELLEELQELIVVKEGGRPKKVSKQRAMLKSLAARALQGDTKAAALIINMIFRLLHQDEEVTDELKPDDLKILKDYEARVLSTSGKKGKKQ